MATQVETANVILLNKCDLFASEAGKETYNRGKRDLLIHHITQQARPRCVRSRYARVGAGLFSLCVCLFCSLHWVSFDTAPCGQGRATDSRGRAACAECFLFFSLHMQSTRQPWPCCVRLTPRRALCRRNAAKCLLIVCSTRYMFMYVCIYLCMWIYLSIHTHTHTHTHTYITHTHSLSRVYICIYVHKHTHTHTRTHTHTHCMYVCMYIYIYTAAFRGCGPDSNAHRRRLAPNHDVSCLPSSEL